MRTFVIVGLRIGKQIDTFTLRVDDDKLLAKYKTKWTEIEGLMHIESDVLPSSFYDDRYIKTKIRTHDDKVYANFCGSNI